MLSSSPPPPKRQAPFTSDDPAEETSLPPPAYSASAPPNNIPPNLPQGTHTLHIYRDTLLGHNLTIREPDKITVAYTVTANTGSLFSSKPHMLVYRGARPPASASNPSPPPVGSVTFRQSSRTIHLTFRHQGSRVVELASTGIFGRAHAFQSAGIGTLKWEGDGLGTGMVLRNGRKEWVARYEGAGLNAGKRGVFEVVNWEIGGESLDEVVVSGVAMVEYMRRR